MNTGKLIRAEHRADILEKIQAIYEKCPLYLKDFVDIAKIKEAIKEQYNIMLVETEDRRNWPL